MGRRSMLLTARPLSAHVQSFLPSHRGSLSLARCVLIPSSTKQENKRDGNRGGDAGRLERDAPTRRTTRSPTRRWRSGDDTDGKQATRHTTRHTTRQDTQDGEYGTPSDENGRTTTKGNWDVPLFSKHHDTNETRRYENTFHPFARPPLPGSSLIRRPQLVPRPRAWDEQAGDRFAGIAGMR